MASHHPHHTHTHHAHHSHHHADAGGGTTAFGEHAPPSDSSDGDTPVARASVPVVTDVTSATPEELEEALHYYGLNALHYKMERTTGGVNNAVYVARPVAGVKDEPVVVRIYRNGNNIARVLYEHAVLRALKAKAASLPFEVPTPHPTQKTGTAVHGYAANSGVDAHHFSTFHVMKSGTAVAVFKLIPGGPAPLSAARNIGCATAQLVRALEDVVIPPSIKSVNPLYRNLYEAHHKITRKLFFERVQSAEFDGVRAHMDSLLARFHDAEALIGVILQGGGLKESVINADLHFDNVLCVGDEVSGLLDFEFAARDWRVMEMVVGLSKYAGLSSPMSVGLAPRRRARSL